MKHVAVFARWPLEGRVKTRLSPALPPALARRLHEAMLADALAAAARSSAERRYLYWADAPAGSMQERDGFEPRPQREGDLGARLVRCFAELGVSTRERVVVVGSDAPDLVSARIDDAFVALDSHDLVIAPSRDGGYGLVGLRRLDPAVFAGIEWGTPRVRAQTLAGAARARLTLHESSPLDDLDTPDDLVRWIARAANGGGVIATHTRRLLREVFLLP